MARTKLGLLQEHKAVLTAAVDSLIDAKAGIDKAIDKLVGDIEEVRGEIAREMSALDTQFRNDALHMKLEDSE